MAHTDCMRGYLTDEENDRITDRFVQLLESQPERWRFENRGSYSLLVYFKPVTVFRFFGLFRWVVSRRSIELYLTSDSRGSLIVSGWGGLTRWNDVTISGNPTEMMARRQARSDRVLAASHALRHSHPQSSPEYRRIIDTIGELEPPSAEVVTLPTKPPIAFTDQRQFATAAE